ncbi:MAG: hypothetical protein ACOYK4_04555 [Candidatus Planktophila sp.]
MSETPLVQGADAQISEVDQEFVKCLEAEAEQLKTAIDDGITPMEAHAKAILNVDALVKIHAVGLDQSLSGDDASQSAVWSRDLACLELCLALLQNVPPLKQAPED